jgi:FkbM family methyltransferase
MQWFPTRLDGLAFDLAKLSRRLRRPVDCRFIEALDLVVQDYMLRQPMPFVLQIGANDGSDHASSLIRKHGLPGLLVEPLPGIFRKLVNSCAGQPQLHFANCLISDRDGEVLFHTVRSDLNLPAWVSEVASLDRRWVVKILSGWRRSHPELGLPANLDLAIEPLRLPAITVRTLMDMHSIAGIDLLIIDTTGHDFEILKSFPFERTQPAIIQFEHSLLSPSDQHASYRLLAGRGYGFLQVGVDTIAYRGPIVERKRGPGASLPGRRLEAEGAG